VVERRKEAQYLEHREEDDTVKGKWTRAIKKYMPKSSLRMEILLDTIKL
jgi:hypothetical protein